MKGFFYRNLKAPITDEADRILQAVGFEEEIRKVVSLLPSGILLASVSRVMVLMFFYRKSTDNVIFGDAGD